MKTDVYKVQRGTDRETILFELERYGMFNRLEADEARRLRLLGEEMLDFVDHLLDRLDCEFWVESTGKAFEVHLKAAAPVTLEQKDELLSLATDHKNMATRGVLGKLGGLFQSLVMGENGLPAGGGYLADMAGEGFLGFSQVWSLGAYQKALPEDRQGKMLEEMEKVAITSLADDLLVGVAAEHVEMIAKIAF